MPSRKTLPCGAPRLLPNHNGKPGTRYREAFKALEAELGLQTPLQRLEAGRVAALWVALRSALDAWYGAHEKRTSGKGRRPNAAAVERLARRAGLADGSYSQALDKLRELVSHRKPRDLAQQLAQLTPLGEGRR